MKRLRVIGVGLIGGSFALALKQAKAVAHVVGVGRTRQPEARAASAASSTPSRRTPRARRATRTSCCSRRRSASSRRSFRVAAADPQGVVTDAGSTKRDVDRRGAQGARQGDRALRARRIRSPAPRRAARRRRRRAVPRPARDPHAAAGEPPRRRRRGRSGVGGLRRARQPHGRRASTTRCSPR